MSDIPTMAERAVAPELPLGARGATRQLRRHPRVTVRGKVRLMADTPEGMVTLSGEIVDLSISGCAIRVFARLERDRDARLELEVDGERVWLPGHLRWIRAQLPGWVGGVEFDRLVPAKQRVLMQLVAARRRYTP